MRLVTVAAAVAILPEGCAVTRYWAEANTLTLAAFWRAYEQGQQMRTAAGPPRSRP
jgi:hypothetical protein